MAVMVVGGSGFIGSEVTKALVKNGIDTISCDLIQPSIADGSKWMRADILELTSIERILFEYEVDMIIHLVGLPAIEYCEKNPHFSFLLNVASVQNTLEAMRKADVKKIIFASSAAVYGLHADEPLRETKITAPKSIYGYHKLIAEETIKAYNRSYGISYVILRLFNVYGGNPYSGKDVISIFIRRAIKNEPLLVKGPRKFRDFVHVNDVAKAFLASLREDVLNEVINIGTGEKTTLGDVAQHIKEYFNNVKIIEEQTADDGTGLYADISKAKSVLKFEPIRSREGIGSHIAKYSQTVVVR
jgi:UDP-glucose 4-epimerase